MGTIETVGVIDGGDLTTSARTKYRDNVVSTIKNGITLGAASLAPGLISLGNLETDPIDTVKQNYPAWHGYYIDGLQKNIATLLDSIPAAGILKSIGLFDPTEPIAVVITELQDLFLQIESLIGHPVADILIARIDITIEKSGEIVSAITDEDPEAFFNGVKSTIAAALEAEGVNTDPVIEKIEEKREDIVAKANEIIEKAKISIDVNLPSLSIPSLDISFIDPSLDISPLFATVEVDGYDGIATKFIKLMTVFLSIPAKIVEAAQSAVEAASAAISSIVAALKKIITDFQNAITDLLNAVIDFVWSLISEVLSIVSTAFLEISSTINIVFFFAKCFVISIIGFLLGSGLIALAAAKAFDLV